MTAKVITQETNQQSHNEVAINCPQCYKTWTLNVATFRSSKKRLKAKCGCGCVFDISDYSLDMRKFYRKRTNLRGSYATVNLDKTGFIRIINVSYSGISFELEKETDIEVGDTLGIRFVLDDDNKSEIHRAVRVKNIRDKLVGAEFADSQVFDLELCYYLALS